MLPRERVAFVVGSGGLSAPESTRLCICNVPIPNTTEIHQRPMLMEIMLLLGRSPSYKLLMSVLGSIAACLLGACSLQCVLLLGGGGKILG